MKPSVLITGATKGIGRAIASRFAQGAGELHLVARNEQALQALQSELEHSELRVRVYACDLSIAEAVSTLVESVRDAASNLDVLIHNAGVYLPGLLLDEPDGNLDYMMRLNVLSNYQLTRGLLSLIPRGGQVFHMASVASRKMFINKPSYSITKHAQLTLTEALRHELRPRNIRVTTVMPGPTWSASWDGVDLPEERLLDPKYIADLMWHAYKLPPEVSLEELVIQPQLGDLE